MIGILGLQGAFLDHIPHFNALAVGSTIVRDVKSLGLIDRLVIPGGESTVMAKFLKEFGMLLPIQERIALGLPIWGICAGAILLAEEVDHRPGLLNALPVNVNRNAYGRQINSSRHLIDIPLLNLSGYPAVFIRAPKIESSDPRVSVHAKLDDDPVFLQKDRIMATTFHPELNPGHAFHRYFLSI
jgi:5'-phosphate synthase pdxT subunit